LSETGTGWEIPAHPFDRDLPLQGQVRALVHHAHPAFGQAPVHAVGPGDDLRSLHVARQGSSGLGWSRADAVAGDRVTIERHESRVQAGSGLVFQEGLPDPAQAVEGHGLVQVGHGALGLER
jgi:hypothetical protein